MDREHADGKTAVGILTASARPGVMGGNLANFRRIGAEARRQGLECHVVNVDPAGEVLVWTADGRGWNRSAPDQEIPPVLYNRIPTRRLERSRPVRDALGRLKSGGRIVTNPRFLRKDEVAEIWLKDPDLRNAVPQTRPLRDPQDLAKTLGEWGSVYVKPADGRAGVGILVLSRRRAGIHAVEQRAGRAVDLGLFTRPEAKALVGRLFARKTALLQAAADVSRWNGRRYDLRILLHRSPGGGFDVSGIGVRAAARGDAITTHVPNGGRVADAARTLAEVFGDRAPEILRSAVAVSRRAADRLSQGLGGFWSELSVDAGLSPDGKPWLFEANSKPMKFNEPEIEREGKRRLVRTLSALLPSGGPKQAVRDLTALNDRFK